MKNIEILIVEDSMTQAEELRYILEDYRYSVRHVTDGRMAMELLLHFKPDIIISDIVMPGIDGYRFCSMVKADERLKKIPVILLTSLSDPRDVIKGLECGADSFLVKPYSEKFLIARVQYFIQNSELRKAQTEDSGLEILFADQKYAINSSPRQILDILLSTYENSILKNQELIESNKNLQIVRDDLAKLNASLETKVRLRTQELEKTNTSLREALEELRQTDEELGENQRLLMSIINSTTDAVYVKDENGTYILFNESASKMVGRAQKEVIGKKDTDIFCLEEGETVMEADHRILDSGNVNTIEEVVTLADGEKHYFLSTKGPLFDNEGKRTGIFGIARDFTERRQMDEVLRESEERYRSLFENMFEGYAYCKMLYENGQPSDFIYLKTSRAFNELTGLKDVDGKKVSEVIPGIQKSDSGLIQTYGRVASTGKPERFEIFVESLHDWYSISVYSPRKEYFVAVFDVITKRKQAEEELVVAKEKAEESNRLKSALLTNMSHEVRTPMNAIMGFSNMMMEVEGEEKNEFAAIIQKSSEQLLSLIDDVINLSRLQSEKIKVTKVEFSPAGFLQEVSRTFSTMGLNQGIEIVVNIPVQYKDLVILSDEEKINHALSNLLSNALKYTSKGTVELGFDLRDGVVEFYVKDTGYGIPEKEQRHIFESFFRGEMALSGAIRGHGLGLSIAKELIELLGGSISVNSELNKGSRFGINIPLVKSESKLILKPKVPVAHKNMKDLVILVVDDEQVNFQYFEILLKNVTKQMHHAINGEEAIELATKNNYNLILMDIKMPGMGGIEATKILKQKYPNIPIIAQTAYSLPEEKEFALQSGCNGIITKPIKKKDLMTMIDLYS